MKRYLLLLLLALGVSAVVYAVTATQYYNTGLILYNDKNYPQAVQSFSSALQLEPGNTEALLGRANSYYSLKMYSEALDDYKKVLALQPQNPQVKELIPYIENELKNNPRMIRWRTPAEGLEESIRTGKPILYDIAADWCGPCHRLKKQVFEDGDCAERINKLFVPVRVMDRLREDRKNPEIVAAIEKKYKLRGFPTLVVQYPGKSDYKKTDGYGGREEIMDFLNRAVK
jgi:thiol-disulfide isomerase/thioredoxin